MKIVVGSDHAGFPMKAELLAFLRSALVSDGAAGTPGRDGSG